MKMEGFVIKYIPEKKLVDMIDTWKSLESDYPDHWNVSWNRMNIIENPSSSKGE